MLRRLTTRRRKLVFAAAMVLLVGVVGPFAVSRLRSSGRRVRVRSNPAGTKAEATTALKVVAYNIAHGRGATDGNWDGSVAAKRERVAQIAGLLAETRAEVVVLNEVDFDSTWSGHENQAEAIALAAGFPYWVEHRTLDCRLLYGSVKSGNAVLSRFPIVDAQVLAYPVFKPIEQFLAGSKQGLVCTLELSKGRRVRLLAVHLEHRNEDTRVQSAERIIAAVDASKLPLIAAGDFNSTLTEFPKTRLASDGSNAMDKLVASGRFVVGPVTRPTADELTFPSTKPDRLIDWILAPRGTNFLRYEVLQSDLSDHLPVIAEIAVP